MIISSVVVSRCRCFCKGVNDTKWIWQLGQCWLGPWDGFALAELVGGVGHHGGLCSMWAVRMLLYGDSARPHVGNSCVEVIKVCACIMVALMPHVGGGGGVDAVHQL
jgi:hypothetical protein